jgi:ABC-type glycerol-3-phosphate transport system substrate-binding protein
MPPKVLLKEALGFARPPAGEALAFFNNFSDPTNSLYSWNSSLPDARQSFLRGNLALYIGYASEFDTLRKQNPQLNFDVAALPQREGSVREVVGGNFTALSVLNASHNKNTALQVAYLLTSADFATTLNNELRLAPVRNDVLRSLPPDPTLSVFYNSAIIARSWLDVAPMPTEEIFRALSDDTRSGKYTVDEALVRAQSQMEQLIKK